ncbi:hypothetical protein V4F39_03050 [Aquincola sp. MAHUQ-54]|uniref:Uncharacterized protein n=1 Tax=Aquincola agrisoli TaxID=3119538 RepID=A0AAW9Q9N0_9BURK
MPPLHCRVAGGGACTAAGGVEATSLALAPEAPPLPLPLCGEHDAAGAAVAARLALASGLAPLERISRLVAGAAADLAAASGGAPHRWRPARLFVVMPEATPVWPEAGLAAAAAWLAWCGSERGAPAVGFHAGTLQALQAAQAFLAGAAPQAEAIVLAAESWVALGPLQWLDTLDQLATPSSAGVVPGEAAVLLWLKRDEGTPLWLATADERLDRHVADIHLGSAWSHAVLAACQAARCEPAEVQRVTRGAHASHMGLAREEGFVRARNWPHLDPLQAVADSAVLGYLGHAATLLDLLLLCQSKPPVKGAALASSRSLWRATSVALREAA